MFLAYNASFTACWVNPTWDVCGFRVESEAPQITWAIVAILREMEPLPVNFWDIDDYALKRDFGSAAMQGFCRWDVLWVSVGSGLLLLGLCLLKF